MPADELVGSMSRLNCVWWAFNGGSYDYTLLTASSAPKVLASDGHAMISTWLCTRDVTRARLESDVAAMRSDMLGVAFASDASYSVLAVGKPSRVRAEDENA